MNSNIDCSSTTAASKELLGGPSAQRLPERGFEFRPPITYLSLSPRSRIAYPTMWREAQESRRKITLALYTTCRSLQRNLARAKVIAIYPNHGVMPIVLEEIHD